MAVMASTLAMLGGTPVRGRSVSVSGLDQSVEERGVGESDTSQVHDDHAVLGTELSPLVGEGMGAWPRSPQG